MGDNPTCLMRIYAQYHALGLVLITGILYLIEHEFHIDIARVVRYVLNGNLCLINLGRIGGNRSNDRITYLVAGQPCRLVPGLYLFLKADSRITLHPIQDRIKRDVLKLPFPGLCRYGINQ